MNKVNSKNKGCANKKCSTQQNGAQVKKLECAETKSYDSKDIKTLVGLINGIPNDKKNYNKTSTETSQEINVKLDLSNTEECSSNDSVPLDSNSLTNDDKGKTKKSKSKKRNKTEIAESRLDPSEDINSPDFDITSIIFNKYKDEPKEELKEIVSNLDKLEIKNEKKEEEEPRVENPDIQYVEYESELQMPLIMKIIQKDLSEPYSIYTYRFFIHNWPNLCFLAMCDENCVGAIVCKLDIHRKVIKRGYIAMLAVDKRYRKHGIGSTLVKRAIQEMINGDADEVVLETEITNKPALRLYEALGFVRDKRLFRYYLNGVDALRLKLWLR